MTDTSDNQTYDAKLLAKARRQADSPYSVGPIHGGAFAVAVAIVGLVFAYLAWLGGVQAPADIVGGTSVVLGTIAGWVFPNS